MRIHDGSVMIKTGDYTINNNSDFIFFEWNEARTDIVHVSYEDYCDNKKKVMHLLGFDSETYDNIKDHCNSGESYIYDNGICIRF